MIDELRPPIVGRSVMLHLRCAGRKAGPEILAAFDAAGAVLSDHSRAEWMTGPTAYVDSLPPWRNDSTKVPLRGLLRETAAGTEIALLGSHDDFPCDTTEARLHRFYEFAVAFSDAVEPASGAIGTPEEVFPFSIALTPGAALPWIVLEGPGDGRVTAISNQDWSTIERPWGNVRVLRRHLGGWPPVCHHSQRDPFGDVYLVCGLRDDDEVVDGKSLRDYLLASVNTLVPPFLPHEAPHELTRWLNSSQNSRRGPLRGFLTEEGWNVVVGVPIALVGTDGRTKEPEILSFVAAADGFEEAQATFQSMGIHRGPRFYLVWTREGVEREA